MFLAFICILAEPDFYTCSFKMWVLVSRVGLNPVSNNQHIRDIGGNIVGCVHQTSSVTARQKPQFSTTDNRQVREETGGAKQSRGGQMEERWRKCTTERDAGALDQVGAGYKWRLQYRQLLLEQYSVREFLSTLNSTHSRTECHGFHTSIFSSTHE